MTDLDLHTQDNDRLLYMLNSEIQMLIDRELGLAQIRRRFLAEPFHHWKDVWRFKPPEIEEIEDSGSSDSAAMSDLLNGRFNETRDSADSDDQGYHGWLEEMRYMGWLEEID